MENKPESDQTRGCSGKAATVVSSILQRNGRFEMG